MWSLPSKVALAALVLPIVARAGSLSGVVVDRAGRPLPAANVVVQGTERGAAADDHGAFVIRDLPPGRYGLVATVIGYEAGRADIVVPPSGVAGVRIVLAESPVEMPAVVTSATFADRAVHLVPAEVAVVDRDDIVARGAMNLAAALEQTPGVSIAQSFEGSTVSMLGMDSKYVLVMVDGQPVVGRVNEKLDASRLSLGNVERIEIVKGPWSSLFGSEAMGGVINVITREAERPFEATTRLRLDSHGDATAEAAAGANVGKARASFSVSGESRGGVDMDDDGTWDTPDRGAWSWTARAAWRFDENRCVWASVSDDRDERSVQDPVFEDVTHERRGRYELGARTTSGRFVITGRVYVSRFVHSFDKSVRSSGYDIPKSATEEQLDRGEIRAEGRCLGAGWSFGVEGSRDRMWSPILSGVERRARIAAVFAQAEMFPESRVSLFVGSRFDDHSQFGGHVSPRIGFLSRLGRGHQARLSVGFGYRSPSLKELYVDFDHREVGYLIEGNPDLRPEESLGVMAAWTFTSRAADVGVTLFVNRLSDLIAPVAIDDTGPYLLLSYENIDEGTTYGAEISARFHQSDDYEASFGGTYVVARDGDGSDLPLRPRWSGNARFSIEWPAIDTRFIVRLDGRTSSSTGDGTGSRTPSYLVANLQLERALWGNTSASVGVDNAFDVSDATFGPKPGRTFYCGISAEF